MRLRPTASFGVLALVYLQAVAYAQIQQPGLTASLKGIEATSLVSVGSSGFPAGVNGAYGLPVNTLVYPDGQVIYRVEFGLTRGEVVQMRDSFGVGTPLQIKDVEFKDDRMELKLRGRNGNSGRLKVMLGAGWQSKMTNAGALESIAKFLTLPEPPPTSTGLELSHSPTGTPSSIAPQVTAPLYSRPSGAVVFVERAPESEIRDILLNLQHQRVETANEVTTQARFFSQSFQAFEDAYSREKWNRGVQAIEQLRSNLGAGFVPHTDADIEEIRQVFAQCLYLARLRSVGGGYGPGANSPAYQKAFPGTGDIGDAQLHSTDLLNTSFTRRSQIAHAEQAIIGIEQDLDAGRLDSATATFSEIQQSGDQALAAYLQQSIALRADLMALKAAQQLTSLGTQSIGNSVHTVLSEESALSESLHKPLTAAYLQQRITADKVTLKAQLQSLPPFEKPKEESSSDQLHLSEAEAGVRLTNIKDALSASASLALITKDQETLSKIRTWYGDDFYRDVLGKADGITEAESTAVRLDAYVTAQRSAEQAEAARKQAALAQRVSLAEQIVNTALIVTKLDEEFARTEIMGYSIEAEKQRTRLRGLATANRSMLSSTLWASVHERFQQILPGLTVWEATHTRTLLAELQH